MASDTVRAISPSDNRKHVAPPPIHRRRQKSTASTRPAKGFYQVALKRVSRSEHVVAAYRPVRRVTRALSPPVTPLLLGAARSGHIASSHRFNIIYIFWGCWLGVRRAYGCLPAAITRGLHCTAPPSKHSLPPFPPAWHVDTATRHPKASCGTIHCLDT